MASLAFQTWRGKWRTPSKHGIHSSQSCRIPLHAVSFRIMPFTGSSKPTEMWRSCKWRECHDESEKEHKQRDPLPVLANRKVINFSPLLSTLLMRFYYLLTSRRTSLTNWNETESSPSSSSSRLAVFLLGTYHIHIPPLSHLPLDMY